MSNFDPLIYNKHFITKVKKRGRIRKLFNWIVFGALALQYFQVWTWDGQVLKKESGFIEKSLTKKKPIKSVGMVLTTTNVYFISIGAQTWTVPTDWNNGNNSIECIGGGGGAGPAINYYAGGGAGGGAYAKSVNISMSGTVYLNVSDIAAGDGFTHGGNTWVNFTSNASPGNASQGVLAVGGTKGRGWSGSSAVGGAGGLSSSCFANLVAYSGGHGGTNTNINYSTGAGGGGAAGPNGNGNPGSDTTSSDTWSGFGGDGDAGYGGAGGPGQSSDNWGNPGSFGAEWGSYGSGGGASGARSVDDGTARQGGAGGQYGGGGGGGSGQNGGGGYGNAGLIVITYVPLLPGGMITLLMGI